MKHLLALLLSLISITASSNAQTNGETRKVLIEKLRILEPDNMYDDEKKKAADAAYLKKHQPLIDSLGKNEIFHHLELTTDLYSENRPGFQPHATYAVYLYSRFHEEYSPEEYETIAAKVREFSEKGWISKKDLDEFEAIQSHKELKARHPEDDAKVAILLSGRKNPGDQEAIDSLGIVSLDFLLTRLKAEEDQNKLPIYSRLIGSKYRQFSKDLTPEKKTQIITTLCAKIGAVRDEGETAYLIQSSFGHLHGIDHPAVRGLMEVRLKSTDEGTRKAAQSLKESLEPQQ